MILKQLRQNLALAIRIMKGGEVRLGTAEGLFNFEEYYGVRSLEEKVKTLPEQIKNLEEQLLPIIRRKRELEQQIKDQERNFRRMAEVEFPSSIRGNKTKQTERYEEYVESSNIAELREQVAACDRQKEDIDFEISQLERELKSAQYLIELNASRLRYLGN